MEKITTLYELDNYWTYQDLLDCHELLDARDAAISKTIKGAGG